MGRLSNKNRNGVFALAASAAGSLLSALPAAAQTYSVPISNPSDVSSMTVTNTAEEATTEKAGFVLDFSSATKTASTTHTNASSSKQFTYSREGNKLSPNVTARHYTADDAKDELSELYAVADFYTSKDLSPDNITVVVFQTHNAHGGLDPRTKVVGYMAEEIIEDVDHLTDSDINILYYPAEAFKEFMHTQITLATTRANDLTLSDIQKYRGTSVLMFVGDSPVVFYALDTANPSISQKTALIYDRTDMVDNDGSIRQPETKLEKAVVDKIEAGIKDRSDHLKNILEQEGLLNNTLALSPMALSR